MRALQKDPRQRFEDVHAFAIALEQASFNPNYRVVPGIASNWGSTRLRGLIKEDSLPPAATMSIRTSGKRKPETSSAPSTHIQYLV